MIPSLVSHLPFELTKSCFQGNYLSAPLQKSLGYMWHKPHPSTLDTLTQYIKIETPYTLHSYDAPNLLMPLDWIGFCINSQENTEWNNYGMTPTFWPTRSPCDHSLDTLNRIDEFGYWPFPMPQLRDQQLYEWSTPPWPTRNNICSHDYFYSHTENPQDNLLHPRSPGIQFLLHFFHTSLPTSILLLKQ